MQKREKIMLGVLGAAVAYAAFTLLGDQQAAKPTPDRNKAAYETVVSEINLRMTAAALNPAQARRVELLQSPPPAAPFYASDGQFFFTGGAETDDGNAIVYSGYLESPQGALAIINGGEYEQGDELAFGGYHLLTVNKGFVVIERRDAATGNLYKRQIPLAVDDIEQIGLKTIR